MNSNPCLFEELVMFHRHIPLINTSSKLEAVQHETRERNQANLQQ